MSIEGGSMTAPIATINMGPTISVRPAMEAKLTARFGPSVTAESILASSPIIKESLVRASLADFKPLGAKDVVSPSLNAEDAVKEAELIFSESRSASNIQVELLPQPAKVIEDPILRPPSRPEFFVSLPRIIVLPNQENSRLVSSSSVEPKAVPYEKAHPNPVASSHEVVQPAPTSAQQEVEKVVWQDEQVEAVKKEEKKLEEEIETEERFYLEDEGVVKQRRVEIKDAIKKAQVEAKKLGLKKIAGWLVAKFLPSEHEGNRSEIVKKRGPDGSYHETVEAISATGELESEQEAENRFDEIILEKPPVKKGKHGRKVGIDTVVRVFKFQLFKPFPAKEIVQTRKVLKTVQTLVTETYKAKAEPTVANYPDLAEALKAA